MLLIAAEHGSVAADVGDQQPRRGKVCGHRHFADDIGDSLFRQYRRVRRPCLQVAAIEHCGDAQHASQRSEQDRHPHQPRRGGNDSYVNPSCQRDGFRLIGQGAKHRADRRHHVRHAMKNIHDVEQQANDRVEQRRHHRRDDERDDEVRGMAGKRDAPAGAPVSCDRIEEAFAFARSPLRDRGCGSVIFYCGNAVHETFLFGLTFPYLMSRRARSIAQEGMRGAGDPYASKRSLRGQYRGRRSISSSFR